MNEIYFLIINIWYNKNPIKYHTVGNSSKITRKKQRQYLYIWHTYTLLNYAALNPMKVIPEMHRVD